MRREGSKREGVGEGKREREKERGREREIRRRGSKHIC